MSSWWGTPAWMRNYDETHEIVRADDVPTQYRVCNTCFGLVPPWRLEGHYNYHKDRGDLGE